MTNCHSNFNLLEKVFLLLMLEWFKWFDMFLFLNKVSDLSIILLKGFNLYILCVKIFYTDIQLYIIILAKVFNLIIYYLKIFTNIII